jgi:hypothetical protein
MAQERLSVNNTIMKVICTTHENFSGIALDRNRPEIGDIVTVVGESIHKGVPVYYFKEWVSPFDWKEIWGYDKRNYSHLSSIDEIKLVNKKEEVHA